MEYRRRRRVASGHDKGVETFLPRADSCGALALAAGAAAALPATAATAAPYKCAPNGPAGSQTVYGTFGDASVIGWAGNSQGVVACLGGSFWVDTSGPDGGPGSASTAAVTGTTYGYGIYDDSPTTWVNADGYLPALVTTFHRDGATIAITNFGDEVTIGGNSFVIIYSRVREQPDRLSDHRRPAGLGRADPAELGVGRGAGAQHGEP